MNISSLPCVDPECMTTAAAHTMEDGWAEEAGRGRFGPPPEMLQTIAQIRWTRDIFIVSTYTPILIFGVTGNSLSFYLLFAKAKTSSTHLYLCSLCVADNLFLIPSVVGYLTSFFSGSDWRGVIGCNTALALIRIPKLVSAWVLVTVSAERTLVVFLPTKAKKICQVRTARALVVVIVLAIVVIQWIVFGGYRTAFNEERGSIVCAGRTDAIQWYIDNVNTWIRTSVYSYIPTALLFVLNSAMAVKFGMTARQNQIGVAGLPTTGSANSGGNAEGAKGRTMAKYSRRMTITAMSLSVTYLCLTLPYNGYFLWFRINIDDLSLDRVEFTRAFMVRGMLEVMVHANHAVNFALYCLTSSAFRRNMLAALTCGRFGRTPELSTGTRASTS